MRITFKYSIGQLLPLLLLAALCSCGIRKEEAPVIPPLTSPLSADFIGFGVITESFAHVSIDPAENSTSLGYLRRGSLVKIVRRQSVRSSGGFQSWVLIDGEQHGWLKEEVMDIYSNESQAKTASESIFR